MTSPANPDEIIEQFGGCGRFQIMINVASHAMKTVVCFSIMSMVIISRTPPWWCNDEVALNNMTSCVAFENGTEIFRCPEKTCSINGTKCSSFGYNKRTLVSEFNLVCDLDYIPSFIMSLQVAGTLVGNVMAGHVAEYIGRKKPFFFSVAIFVVFNLFGYFSTNWIMFTVVRVFIGLAAGVFMTSTYSLLCEFSSAKWRVWIIGFPSWPIEACIFALIAWLVQDWRHLQLLIALVGIPCLLPWFIIPESFRWYIAHDKLEQAKEIIHKVAAFNKREISNLTELMTSQPTTDPDSKKYSLVDLFRTRKLTRITLLSSMNWFALGIVSYGISFGIQSLSGNIYLNFFLFSIVGIPSKVIALWLQNRIGRRGTTMLCHLLVIIGGFAVGIIEGMDIDNKGAMINGFAQLANIGITTAWGSVQTMTIELYPTVIRPIGFGTLSVVGRIGAIIGPQLVYVNLQKPGLMYYVLGGVSTICLLGCLGLPETKNANLNDKIQTKSNIVSPEIKPQKLDTNGHNNEKKVVENTIV
ncbi:hypothetical protein ACF0H5_001407 [Mactra antiquata]